MTAEGRPAAARRHSLHKPPQDDAGPVDEEGLRRGINAPVDGVAARTIDAHGVIGVAELVQEAEGVVGGVLVVDANEAEAVVLRERQKIGNDYADNAEQDAGDTPAKRVVTGDTNAASNQQLGQR